MAIRIHRAEQSKEEHQKRLEALKKATIEFYKKREGQR